MGKTRKVFTQVVAIVLLLGILTIGVYGLYIGMDELDKPVSLMKTDSVSNYIEINGNGHYDDYSIFGAGKNDLQKLYIQSVLNSINSGKTIHVSRWVTSGDWSQDNEDMTITIP